MAKILAMILGILVGILAGGAFGVALGILVAPAVDSRKPLMHEWYMMAVFAYIFWSVVGGAILGLIVGASPRPATIEGTSAGSLIGLLVGVIAWKNGLAITSGDSTLPYTGFTIILFAFGTAILGAIAGSIWSTIRRSSAGTSQVQGPFRVMVLFIFVCAAASLVVLLYFLFGRQLLPI